MLLSRALECLDSLPARGLAQPAWSFGGGTLLMLRYGHRLSRDVDIFLHDAQYVAALSPRINSRVAELTDDYAETASALKLAFADGAVDFIVAPRLLGLEPRTEIIDGRPIPCDASAEIVAKKLFYRTVSLKPRDVLDLAVVLAREPDAAPLIAGVLKGKRDALERSLTRLRTRFEERCRAEMHLLAAGEAALGTALASARTFVDALPRS